MTAGEVLPALLIRQLEAPDQPDPSRDSVVVGRGSCLDPWGEKGRCFPRSIVPEASPEIFESPMFFPRVDLGGARLISWAPARLQELLPKSGFGGRRGQSPLSPHRDPSPNTNLRLRRLQELLPKSGLGGQRGQFPFLPTGIQARIPTSR